MRHILLFAVLAMVCPAATSAAPLRAAVGQVDITPPAGTPMWGFARRAGAATGTLDPLYARVLVLDAPGRRVAIVALDLGRPFGEPAIAELRKRVASEARVDYVFVTASHTHSGPVIRDDYADGAEPAWLTAALRKTGDAIVTASRQLSEARIGAGFGMAYIGHNRLRTEPDGSVTWLDRNPTRIPTAPFDPTVGVLRVDRADGSPLAILVNYACHPVVLGPDNLQFSADYPGAMARVVEQAFDSHPVTFFLPGGSGDINPYFAVTPLAEDARGRMEWTGAELGREAVRIARGIRTSDTAASIDYVEQPESFHLRWDMAKFRAGMAEIFGADFEQFGPRIEEQMQLPVACILINRTIALAGLPGEPFVDFQMNWRSRAPVHDAFLAGYANGYHGYFPTLEMTTRAGYGTSSVTTWVEPGAGERMIDRALIQLYTLMGKLGNVPYRTAY